MTPTPNTPSQEGAAHTCPGYLTDPPELQRAIDEAGFWLGCEHPERPVDALMVTIAGCTGCQIAHEAAVRMGVPTSNTNTVDDTLARLGATHV